MTSTPMIRFPVGARVRIVHERYRNGEPDRDYGQAGTVIRTPGQEATPGAGPGTTYAVQLDGSPYPRGAIPEDYLAPAGDDESTCAHPECVAGRAAATDSVAAGDPF